MIDVPKDEPYRVVDVQKPANDYAIVTLEFLNRELNKPQPGQFVMFTIPSKERDKPPIGQCPISISQPYPLEVAVKSVGSRTEAIINLQPRDEVLIRGPLGKGVFPVGRFTSPVYLIGGGVGLAPLRCLANTLKGIGGFDVTTFIGARSSDRLLFERDFQRVGRVYVATDDGSKGMRGWIDKLLEEHTGELQREGTVALCGREPMMLQVLSIIRGNFPSSNIYLTMERRIDCGAGLCGHCDFGGYRICVDGPVISYHDILYKGGMARDMLGGLGRDETGNRRVLY